MRKFLSFVITLTMLLSLGASLPASEVALAEGETITWYVYHQEPYNNAPVMEKVNEIISSTLGCRLEVKWTDPGAYTDKLNLLVSAGDEFDLAYVCNWVLPKYSDLLGKGALLALDDYMTDEYMPNVLAAIPEAVWDGVRANGKHYGIPNLQVMYDENGIAFNKRMADEAGVTDAVLALSDPNATPDDLTPIFEKVREYDPNLILTITNITTIGRDRFEYPSIDTTGFVYDDKAGKIIFSMDTKYAMDDYRRAREWYEKGYLPSDASTVAGLTDTYKNTQELFCWYNRQKPGGLVELERNHGYEFYNVSTSERLMSTAGITSTLTGVSVTSKNPGLAIKVYDLFYANKELYNTIVFGLEGQDYNWVDDAHIEVTENAYSAYAWMMGNQFNAYLTVGQDEGIWEETAEGNNSAGVDSLCGLVINREPIEAELAAISAIVEEYNGILNYGLTDDIEGAYKECKAKCEAAGLNDCIAELQSQIDAFLASNA